MEQGNGFGAPGSSKQKKVAVINDIAGFGRCALSVALPVISRLKVQCCPVPTAVLSSNAAIPGFYMDDYTDRMENYISQWRELGLTFDGIGTGFLGSERQIEIVGELIKNFRREDTMVLVDPIMGDNGKLYGACTEKVCGKMKKLVTYGNLVTPNVTEGCILTGRAYHEGNWKEEELFSMARELSAMGPEKVVITGVPQGTYIGNYCYEKGEDKGVLRRVKRVGETRCGTGDIFSAVLLADGVNGVPLEKSVKKAADFIKDCIRVSVKMEVPLTDGVCFEEVLGELRP
ncbi:MAG: pyridoxamine kinase [Hungatella sp.]|nr:pyridoxamine kinase [Hungatella sp.]